jgi:hypothetical protein
MFPYTSASLQNKTAEADLAGQFPTERAGTEQRKVSDIPHRYSKTSKSNYYYYYSHKEKHINFIWR